MHTQCVCVCVCASVLHLAEFGLVLLHQPFLVLFELLHSLRQRIHLRRDYATVNEILEVLHDTIMYDNN